MNSYKQLTYEQRYQIYFMWKMWQYYGVMMPLRMAYLTSSLRLGKFNLRIMFSRWRATERLLMTNSSAISSFDRPSASSSSTSCSRGERPFNEPMFFSSWDRLRKSDTNAFVRKGCLGIYPIQGKSLSPLRIGEGVVELQATSRRLHMTDENRLFISWEGWCGSKNS